MKRIPLSFAALFGFWLFGLVARYAWEYFHPYIKTN